MSSSSAPVVDVDADSDDAVVDVTIDGSEDDDAQFVENKALAHAPPLRFRGYRRGQELGRGASGCVFVCKKKGVSSGFAVKAIDLRRLRLSPNEQREQKKLRREVDILKKLPPHPSIVQMIDAFEEGEWCLLVLELVGGGDLFTVLTTRDPPRLLDREASHVLRQLADGLAFLHSQGVIHRDLKLENVLVASERREKPLVLYTVKITDFGLSKVVGAGFSEAKSRVGTRPYAAPEIWSDESYDCRSDIWSLGVVLYVLLAGCFPFSKVPSTQAELDRIAERLSKSKASEAAKSAVRGLLQLDPGKRLSLEKFCGHEWFVGRSDIEADIKLLEPPAKRQALESRRPPEPSPELPAPTPNVQPPAAASRATPEAVVVDVPRTVIPDSPVKAVAEAKVCQVEEPVAAPANADRQPMGVDAPEAETAVEKSPKDVAPAPPEKSGPDETEMDFPPLPPGSPGSTGCALQTPGISNIGGSASVLQRLSEVCPASSQAGDLQLHFFVADPFVPIILDSAGSALKDQVAGAGCKIWVTAAQPGSDRRVVTIGNYKQCVMVQEFICKQIADKLRTEGAVSPETRDDSLEVEAVLLIRAEAAGVVIGKQGFVIKRLQKLSGARIQVQREEVEGQRPCVISGSLTSVLKAEMHIFDLVRAVPLRHDSTGPNLPRSRIGDDKLTGTVVFWKPSSNYGWIQPDQPIVHEMASRHKGDLYIHEKDVAGGGPLRKGQKVTFYVYVDKTGLGAEVCTGQ
eukprot:TRINITY_DN81692_c0_g1_i1.p1 TRINITY_DN81692_c0_g1~~TRINITY_DN81692_c0_g1_i1.p1  ORF type:complete len:743 (-),score=165.22 TRINITY_DN81692_c0_g1_i1:106-2334(-)